MFQYADDESSTEDETSAPIATSPITTTSTTSTTSTTPRPVITTQPHEHRDPRLYDGTSTVHNNGLPTPYNSPKINPKIQQHQTMKNGKCKLIVNYYYQDNK